MEQTQDTINTILDIDSILDMAMDNVVDIPDYVTPDTGLYTLSIKDVTIKPGKDDTKAARIIVLIAIDSTLQLADNGMPVADGSLFQQSYQGTKEGLEFFKRDAKKWLNVEELSGLSMSDVFEGLKASEPITAKVTQRKTTSKVKDMETGETSTKTYTNISIDPIHGEVGNA